MGRWGVRGQLRHPELTGGRAATGLWIGSPSDAAEFTYELFVGNSGSAFNPEV